MNGKVERSPQTDLEEFWATVDLSTPDLEEQLQLWQHFSNWDHPHSALVGKTPIDRYRELLDRTPLHEEVAGAYHPANARIREQSYAVDMALAALRRSV